MTAAPLPPYHVFPDFLDVRQHEALLHLALASEGDFSPATVVAGTKEVVDTGQRTSRKRKGGLGALKETFSDRVRGAAELMFAKTGVPQAEIWKLELELVAHNDGDRFGRHIDTLTGDPAGDREATRSARLLSGVYYFYQEPRGFTGGELRVHRFGGDGGPGNFVDIDPAQNSFVVFPSFASHEVLKVSCPSRLFQRSRFSVNCWIHRRL